MSDVSHEPLSSTPTVNPYFQTMRNCIEKLTIGGSIQYLKGKKEEVLNIVYDSGFFNDEYQTILDNYDENAREKLEGFKRELVRAINCGMQGTFMGMPGEFHKTRVMCRGRGCMTCTPYKAKERCRYTDTITRIVMVNDIDAATGLTAEIKSLFEGEGWAWLAVVRTPFADGTAMVRISNLRESEMNPLIDDNEVKASVAAFDKLYPMFEEVTRVSADGSLEAIYISSTNQVQFTSTDLYSGRPEGRSGANTREGGTVKGFEYDAELGQIIHMTDAERKKKERQEQGVVGTLNIIVASTKGVTDEHLHRAVAKGVDSIIEGDIGVMKADDLPSIKHLSTTFMESMRNSLSFNGYSQPDMFHNVLIKQEDIDKFYNTYGITSVPVPDNLMEIEYTDEMLGIGLKKIGLIQRFQILKNKDHYQVQKRIKEALTRDELIEKLVEDIKALD